MQVPKCPEFQADIGCKPYCSSTDCNVKRKSDALANFLALSSRLICDNAIADAMQPLVEVRQRCGASRVYHLQRLLVVCIDRALYSFLNLLVPSLQGPEGIGGLVCMWVILTCRQWSHRGYQFA